MVMTVTPAGELGSQAPDFNLPGIDGRNHTLTSACGPNGLLVMFICNHCPYVKTALPRIVRDARELAALGIGSIAIMSNDPMQNREDDWETMSIVARMEAFPFPYVLDATQEVARAYGAVCTPDFFGYNRRQELQYRGRLDVSQPDLSEEESPRELFKAMKQVALMGYGPSEQHPSIGCSIKWR